MSRRVVTIHAPKIGVSSLLPALAVLLISCADPYALGRDDDEFALENARGEDCATCSDECDRTRECVELYGPSATDCKDSRSDDSVCMCGLTACADESPPPPDPPEDAPEESVDDTFACLSGSGPKVRVNDDFGTDDYSNRQAADHTLFDARGSTWSTQQTPSLENPYPVSLGGAENGCFAGGVVDGTTPLTADWRERYGHTGDAGGNSTAVFVENTNNFTFTGLRLDNAWDNIRARGSSNHFVVQNSWITDGHDDCIEDDALNSGLVEDSLFDGCFVLFSARPGASAQVTSSTGANAEVRIEGNLIHMKAIPRDGVPQEGHLFKVSGTAGGPQFAFHDNLILHRGEKPYASADADLPATTSPPSSKLESCSGNVLIWLGVGPFPGSWPNTKFPGCMKIVTGQAGLDLWNEARMNWINCHPDIERLPGDPLSQPSECDPDFWGGGR